MPIPLRGDFAAAGVLRAARNSKDAGQTRRLLALAGIYDGGTRTEAARAGGVTLQIVRDWVMKFNAHGPAGLIGGKAPGKPRLLNDAHRAALAAAVERGAYPGRAWRGALADRRSLPMAVRGVPGQRIRADAEPGAARTRLSQAVGTPSPSCSGGRCDRGF